MYRIRELGLNRHHAEVEPSSSSYVATRRSWIMIVILFDPMQWISIIKIEILFFVWNILLLNEWHRGNVFYGIKLENQKMSKILKSRDQETNADWKIGGSENRWWSLKITHPLVKHVNSYSNFHECSYIYPKYTISVFLISPQIVFPFSSSPTPTLFIFHTLTKWLHLSPWELC